MAFYTDNLRITAVEESDLGLVVSAWTSHTDKVVQCYASGDLLDWQRPVGGGVRFILRQAGPNDVLFLLAVDPGEERTSHWRDAFGAGERYGNRIDLRLRRDLLDGRRPGDRWRVYRGEPGDSAADILLHEADVFVGGRGACGWGLDWGRGGWGYSGSNAPGWGGRWGWTWGFGIDYLSYSTDPLDRGTYPVKVDLVDAHGNASAAYEATVAIDGFARPAEDLSVSSYDEATDALVLSMTPSPDFA